MSLHTSPEKLPESSESLNVTLEEKAGTIAASRIVIVALSLIQ